MPLTAAWKDASALRLRDPGAMTDPRASWDALYAGGGRLSWDMGKATPVLEEALDLARPLGLAPGASVVVPGCGYGHDAAALAALGFAATGLDFAPLALAGAQARHGTSVRWLQEDWFTTAQGPWDAVFDHTCMVSMPPERWPAYAEACARRLRPGGLWLLVAFHDVEGRPAPPHPAAPEDLRRLAEPAFEVLHLACARRSHPRRAGRETLMVARRT